MSFCQSMSFPEIMVRLFWISVRISLERVPVLSVRECGVLVNIVEPFVQPSQTTLDFLQPFLAISAPRQGEAQVELRHVVVVVKRDRSLQSLASLRILSRDVVSPPEVGPGSLRKYAEVQMV